MSVISDSKNFCFIHIHRTGGKTVKDVISKQIEDLRLIYGNLCTLDTAFNFYPYLDNYNIFSYVRNPYDLVVSIYENILSDPNIVDYYAIKNLSFYEFINWLYYVGFKKEETTYSTFYRTQTDFLLVDNKIKVDNIFKFETLSNDNSSSSLSTILLNLNLDFSNIPITNRSNRKICFQDYYDVKSYRLVNKIFKSDFENFNYKMYVC